MTMTSFPFDSQDTTEDQFTKLFRELGDTGVAGSFGGTDLKVTGNGTGLKVRVGAGVAIIRGHCFMSTAIEDLPIQPADGFARIDLVVLTLDPAADSITLQVLKGGLGGNEPTLTQTDTGVYQYALGSVYVGAGVVTITSDKVTDKRTFGGTSTGTWTTSTRPKTPRWGKLGLNLDAGAWEYWDGVAWTSFSINWNNVLGKPATYPPSDHTHEAKTLTNRTSRKLVNCPSVGPFHNDRLIKSTSVEVPTSNSEIFVRWTGRAVGGATIAGGGVIITCSSGTRTGSFNTYQYTIQPGEAVACPNESWFTNVAAGTVTIEARSLVGDDSDTLGYAGTLFIEVIPG